jgi:hypothetical protein
MDSWNYQAKGNRHSAKSTIFTACRKGLFAKLPNILNFEKVQNFNGLNVKDTPPGLPRAKSRAMHGCALARSAEQSFTLSSFP